MREAQSNAIVNKLADNGHCAITQTQAVCGSGGIGKTQLALHYAHTHRTHYAFVRVIIAETKTAATEEQSILVAKIRSLALALGVVNHQALSLPDLRQAIRVCLISAADRLQNKKFLIIFDNADNFDLLIPYLQCLEFKTMGFSADILITTRDYDWPEALPIGVYEEYEALSYVLRTLNKKPEHRIYLFPEKGSDKTNEAVIFNQQFIALRESNYTITESGWPEIKATLKANIPNTLQLVLEFVNRLDRYPITLTHALAYCVKRKTNIADYLDAFDTCLSKVIQGHPQPKRKAPFDRRGHFDRIILGGSSKYPTTIYIAFKLSLDTLLNFAISDDYLDCQIGQFSLVMLGMLSYLSSDGLFIDLLKACFREAAQHIPVANACDQEEIFIDDIIDELKALGLIWSLNKASEPTTTYETHRLVQEVIRLYMQFEIMDISSDPKQLLQSFLAPARLMETLVRAINQLYPPFTVLDDMCEPEYTQYPLLAHLLTIDNHYQLDQMNRFQINPAWIQLYSTLGVLHGINRHHHLALACQKKALQWVFDLPTEVGELAIKLQLRQSKQLIALRQLLEAKRLLLNVFGLQSDVSLATFVPKESVIKATLELQLVYSELLGHLYNKTEAERMIVAILADKEPHSKAGKRNDSSKASDIFVVTMLQQRLADLLLGIGQHDRVETLLQSAITALMGMEKTEANTILLSRCYETNCQLAMARIAKDPAHRTSDEGLATAMAEQSIALLEGDNIQSLSPLDFGSTLLRFAQTLLPAIGEQARQCQMSMASRGKALLEALITADPIHPKALYYLGMGYQAGVFIEHKKPYSQSKAFSYFEQASDLKESLSKTELAQNYLNGEGFVKRFTRYIREDRAYDLLDSAAASNDFMASYYLGKMIEDRQGRARDWDERKRLRAMQQHYEIAAFSGMPEGEYALGRYYLVEGAALEEAWPWIALAKEQQLESAKVLLLVMRLTNVDGIQDKESEFKSLCDQFGCAHLFEKRMDFIRHVIAADYADGLNKLIRSGIVSVNARDSENDGVTLIITAYLLGKKRSIQALMSLGGDPKIRDYNDLSVLHAAACGGHAEIVKLALEVGLEINARKENGTTPLLQAAMAGQLSAFQALCKSGADMTLTTHQDFSVLHAAAYGGHVEIIELALEANLKVNARRQDGSTPLLQAAMRGQLSAFQALCKSGADMTLTTHQDFSVLHAAAQGGHIEIVNLALKANLEVNARRQDGTTPLLVAAMGGQLPAFQALYSNGADMTLTDYQSFSVLHAAAQGGHIEIVNLVLKSGLAVNARTRDGRTPLLQAAISGQLSAFQALYSNGADIRLTDYRRVSVLHTAANGGHVEILKLALDANLEVNARMQDGRTPLLQAAMAGQLSAFQALCKSGADMTLTDHQGFSILHAAAYGGHVEIIELALTAKLKVNARRQDGITPLLQAAMAGQLSAFQALCKSGADMTLTDHQGASVLHAAAYGGHVEILELALKAKLKVNACRKNGTTPLLAAAMHGQLSAFQVLYSNGADMTLTDHQGFSVLHAAAQGGHIEIVNLALKAGLEKINARMQDGTTPLLQAAMHGQLSAFQALCKNGADMTLTDHQDFSILHAAAYQGHVEILKLALEAGLEINARTQDSITPLYYATFSGHLNILKFLVSKIVDLKAQDNMQENILFLAISEKHFHVLEYYLSLQDIQWDLNRRLHNGMSLWECAIKTGDERIKDLLSSFLPMKSVLQGQSTLFRQARSYEDFLQLYGDKSISLDRRSGDYRIDARCSIS